MKKSIINVLGSDHLTPCVINDMNLAIYTYEGEIYCIRDCMDFPFEDLEESERQSIESAILNSEYIEDDTYQG